MFKKYLYIVMIFIVYIVKGESSCDKVYNFTPIKVVTGLTNKERKEIIFAFYTGSFKYSRYIDTYYNDSLSEGANFNELLNLDMNPKNTGINMIVPENGYKFFILKNKRALYFNTSGEKFLIEEKYLKTSNILTLIEEKAKQEEENISLIGISLRPVNSNNIEKEILDIIIINKNNGYYYHYLKRGTEKKSLDKSIIEEIKKMIDYSENSKLDIIG